MGIMSFLVFLAYVGVTLLFFGKLLTRKFSGVRSEERRRNVTAIFLGLLALSLMAGLFLALMGQLWILLGLIVLKIISWLRVCLDG